MSFTTKVYANVAAIQNSDRLNADRLRRIVESKSVAEAMKMLAEMGYAYTDTNSVDGFIVAETNALIDFISDNASNDRIKNALISRFTYNNAKLAYKSRFITVPKDGYYRTELDVTKIAAGDYSDVDKYMCAALEALDEENESKPQNIDLELTKAMYASVISCGIPVIKKYFRAEADMKNILSAARMRRLNKSDSAEFISGGKISSETLEESIGAEYFADCFESTPYFEYAENIETGEFDSLWKAERDIDDYLLFMTNRDVAEFGSYQPFLNYYTQTLIELKTVKTALVCIKTNSRDGFFERIPNIYK